MDCNQCIVRLILHQHTTFTFHSYSVMPEPVQIIRTSWSVGKCSHYKVVEPGYQKTKLVATLKKFYGRHHDLVNPYNVAVSRIVSDVFASDAP